MAVISSLMGQFLLRAGALKLGQVNATNWLSHAVSIFSTPELLLGLGCYGMGAIVYILLLTRVNLSVAAPAVAISYVFSVLIGFFVFKEVVPFSRWAGLGLIVAGVILVIWKK